MATNLIETIQSQFTPELLQQLSTVVGESPATTQKAVTGAIPTLLAGLTNLASTADGTTQLGNLLSQGNYGNLLTNATSLLGGGNATQDLLNSGRGILSTLFGGRLSAIIDWLASAFGIKSTSASSLLSLVAPMVLGVLKREQTSQGLSTAGLASLLLSQKDTIARLAPAGLASVLGIGNLANLGAGVAGSATRIASDTARVGTGGSEKVGHYGRGYGRRSVSCCWGSCILCGEVALRSDTPWPIWRCRAGRPFPYLRTLLTINSPGIWRTPPIRRCPRPSSSSA